MLNEPSKFRQLMLYFEGYFSDGSMSPLLTTLMDDTQTEVVQLETCDLCDEGAEYRQCQKCMNDTLVGSHTDEEYEALEARTKIAESEQGKLLQSLIEATKAKQALQQDLLNVKKIAIARGENLGYEDEDWREWLGALEGGDDLTTPK